MFHVSEIFGAGDLSLFDLGPPHICDRQAMLLIDLDGVLSAGTM